MSSNNGTQPTIKEATLSTGKVIKYRKPSGLDYLRMLEGLPDVSALNQPAGTAATPSDRLRAIRGTISLLLECAVEPRYWADMRESDERMRAPWDCPPGRVPLDLSIDELIEFGELITGELQQSSEKASPLSETAES